MLRPLKCPNLRPRLIGYTVTTTSDPAISASIGTLEGTFTNATADHQVDLAFAQPFARSPLAITTPGAAVGGGGSASLESLPTATGMSTLTLNNSENGDVGTSHALVLGFDSTDTGDHGGRFRRMYPVQSTFASPRMIVGSYDSSGVAITGGGEFTTTNNGTGDYTVTFNRGFAKAPVVVANPQVSSQGVQARIQAVDKNSVQIQTFNSAGFGGATAVHFIAYGSDSADEIRKESGPTILVPYRKPRLLAIRITVTAGTPAITLGGGSVTVADNAAGDYDLTFVEAFAQTPVIVGASSDASGGGYYVTTHNVSSTGFSVEVADTDGAGVDPDFLDLLVFGSDSADAF